MGNILINGVSAKTGGGKSILVNFLELLSPEVDKNYFVLTPDYNLYKKYESHNIKIIDIDGLYKNVFLMPYLYDYYFNSIIKKYNINLIFNLADIPIKTNTKQLFLFDWSYAVYPNSIVWKMLDIKSYVVRKLKLFYFKKNLKYVDLMIAQTDVMKDKLSKLYNITSLSVVENAVSLDNLKLKNTSASEIKLPEGIKLLYLTHYYPHKNLEIFIPLAKLIKKKNLNFKIIITISEIQHKNAKVLLSKIIEENLDDVIVNIGPVKMEDVPNLYSLCDGLLMPTLLESFSGTYVEAMYHKLPIFTSSYDFAKGVCKDSAMYFDPTNENEILSSIESLFNDDLKKEDLVKRGTKVLSSLPNWNVAYNLYIENIEKLLERK